MRSRILKLSACLLGITVIAIGLLCYDWYRFLMTPLNLEEQSVDYTLEPGMTVINLANDLQQQGLLKRPRYLIWFARRTGLSAELKAGEYRFTPGTTPKALLEQIAQGKVIPRFLTLVEGWDFYQMMAAVNENSHLRHELTDLSAAALMEKLGYPDQHPEGMFFPETYQFAGGTTDIELLQSAYQMMQDKLQVAWKQRMLGLPYDGPYQALISASIIEKETALVEERPLVASVVVNRLRKGMRLQVDPTVIYGLGEHYEGPLTRADLRKDTPYNTYIHAGLPPTPIALPGESALQAAVNPAETNYFYFVAAGDDGSHQFSETLAEQNEAVKRYREQ